MPLGESLCRGVRSYLEAENPQTFLFNGKPEGRKGGEFPVATPNAGCSGLYSRQPRRPASRKTSRCTPCATPMPPTCWKTDWTLSPSKNCWAMHRDHNGVPARGQVWS